jgi:hypothetical protein
MSDDESSMSSANIEVDEELIGILRELQQPVNKPAAELMVLDRLLLMLRDHRSTSETQLPVGS